MMTQEDEVNMQLNMAKVTEYDAELLKDNIRGLADDILEQCDSLCYNVTKNQSGADSKASNFL